MGLLTSGLESLFRSGMLQGGSVSSSNARNWCESMGKRESIERRIASSLESSAFISWWVISRRFRWKLGYRELSNGGKVRLERFVKPGQGRLRKGTMREYAG